MVTPMRFPNVNYKSALHLVSHLVFWVWNFTFIGVMYIWILPETGFDLWRAARMGDIEPTFIASFAALMLMPLVCTLVGFFKLRKYPILLMRLFYGVEAPLFTLCLLRLFLLRELTPASGFTLGLVVVAIAMFAIEVLSGYAVYRPRLATAQMISHSIMLLVGLYTGVLLLLYTLPLLSMLTVGFLKAFFRFDWLFDIGELMFVFLHPLSFLAGFLFVTSTAVFFSMPYALVNFYVRAWARIRSAFAKQFSYEKSWTITGATVALSLFLFVALQAQPQTKAFRLLAEPSADVASNPSELVSYRQAQLDNSEAIKAGLTNAYLHRYRYLSPWSDSNALTTLYADAFNLSTGGQQFFQNIHNALLSPFLYRGDNSDIEKAQERYETFFDAPIQKSETAAIRRSLQATANRDETKAGLLNLDQKVVYLASQEVAVTEQGDWATVEIHEQYENPTFQDQEIFYSFSLPESATITGLWLGNASAPKLFPFVVSPRGAAQQVYNAEVERAQFQRATDPALLEQVGPRQYRLRVFPIPATEPLPSRWDDETEERTEGPGELHLWMTYQVAQQEGQWLLPQLTEKRNIFWTADTQHVREDGGISLTEDEWFEAGIAAKKAKPQAHAATLSEGYRVTATPLAQKDGQLKNQSIAVVMDSSYSMREHAGDLQQMQSALKSAAKNNSFDIYLAVAEANAEQTAAKVTLKDFSPKQIQFYGSLQPAEMLQQFVASNADRSYDAILLITDEGSYELASDQPNLPELDAPLWIVHLGGELPSAYEDGLLQLLQVGQGGVETTVGTALQRISLNSENAIALDGYLWKVDSLASDQKAADTKASDTKASDLESSSFQAIAARQLIRQQTRSLTPDSLETLDAVHAIAQRTGIVTPYSSMLVLVDERQREALKAAEAGADRFEREVENGQDALTNPGNPLTASVPEPSQVLSLMVGAIALILLRRRSVRV